MKDYITVMSDKVYMQLFRFVFKEIGFKSRFKSDIGSSQPPFKPINHWCDTSIYMQSRHRKIPATAETCVLNKTLYSFM